MKNLVRVEPNNILNRIQKDIIDTFRSNWWPSFADDVSVIAPSEWVPSVDIKEEKDHFIIRADIPGVEPKDIQVSLENGVLSIRGERHSEKEEEKEGVRRSECTYGLFHRRFSLPDTADAEKVSAEGKNGVLKISIGKKEGGKPKLIKIESR